MRQNLYWIKNECLEAGISAYGAEVCRVVDAASERDMLWCGDPAVFNGHSPVLFPYTGRLTNDCYTINGKRYTGSYHGFARHVQHEVIHHEKERLILQLKADEETLKLWPCHFCLQSEFIVDGNALHHILRVKNTGDDAIQFGMGFHPAFAIPFDGEHTAEDYEILFEQLESPLCIDTSANGLQSGRVYYLARNVSKIPIKENLFDRGSHCMVNLKSSKVILAERNSNRKIEVEISSFPYVLLWSSSRSPLRFLCIEPWQSLPGEDCREQTWEEKPAAAVLQPEEQYQCELLTRYWM